MEFTTLKFEVAEHIATITLNRPNVLNAMNAELMGELNQAITQVKTTPAIRVLIITGEGRAFAAGADIAAMMHDPPEVARQGSKFGSDTFLLLEKLSIPVIAAINGFALGGGCELAMACDIRIASEKTKLGQPEVSLGITAGYGGTQRMPRLIPPGIAKELLYTGRIIDAQEALRIGLVNRVVTQEELLPTVQKLAQEIIQKGPRAVALTKELITTGLEMDLEAALAKEQALYSSCYGTAEQQEGMQAFVEKRKPQF